MLHECMMCVEFTAMICLNYLVAVVCMNKCIVNSESLKHLNLEILYFHTCHHTFLAPLHNSLVLVIVWPKLLYDLLCYHKMEGPHLPGVRNNLSWWEEDPVVPGVPQLDGVHVGDVRHAQGPVQGGPGRQIHQAGDAAGGVGHVVHGIQRRIAPRGQVQKPIITCIYI